MSRYRSGSDCWMVREPLGRIPPSEPHTVAQPRHGFPLQYCLALSAWVFYMLEITIDEATVVTDVHAIHASLAIGCHAIKDALPVLS
jgi:hypothetical protein